MARSTKAEALVTRHLILDAAELLFQQHGVSRTTLQDIAQAAGVTRGAIYWHFRDKADLFTAMMERATMPFEELASELVSPPAMNDPIGYIRDRMLRALNLTANNLHMRRVFEIATHKVEYVDELLAVRDRHLNGRNECLSHVERALKTAMRQGLISAAVPARAVALALHCLIDGLIQNWLLDPSCFDLERVGQQAVDTYLGGLKIASTDAAARAEAVLKNAAGSRRVRAQAA